VAPADPLALLDWAESERARAELCELWSGLRCGWPAEWSGLEARGSALRAETRGLLLELAWAAGAEEHALAHARALFAERAPRAFEALVGALERSRAAVLAARLPAASPAELSHAAAAELLAGLPPSARAQAELARWLSAGAGSAEELAALASQAAGARGAEVRAKLLESLGSGLPLEARLAALERAARELQEHGEETELERFSGEARERARALGDAELRARLRPGRWPQVQRGGARDLGRDERELERW